MTTPERGLHTLTYRVDPERLGQLVFYPLTTAFTDAWETFANAVKRRTNRIEVVPRYSNLATALCAVTGQPVRLFPGRDLSPSHKERGFAALLVTTEPIDPWLLTTAMRAFEQLSLDDDKADRLAEHLATAQPVVESVSDHIGRSDGRISAPGWAFRIAQWNLATQIAETPLMVDGHLPIHLRLDTEANLVAWDHPITRTWSAGPRHAMVYLDTAIVTLPGAADLYLRLDAHVARMPIRWYEVKTAWVARNQGDGPLLRLPVRGPWPDRNRPHPEYRDFVTGILQACELDPIPALPDEFPDKPGPVRPIGKPSKHPIGKGPGARFIFQAQQQIQARLELPEPAYRRTRITTSASSGIIPADQIDAAIAASGVPGLRIACLYGAQDSRRRMLDALTTYNLKGPQGLAGIEDGVPVRLTERLSVVCHRDTEILAHGDHLRDLDGLTCLKAEDDHAVVTWAETQWDGTAVDHDAKPLLRAEFGRRGVVAQFLNASHTPSRPRRRADGTTAPAEDHPAKAALRDLLRQAGVIDSRLAEATAAARVAALTRPATLAGVHIRQHSPRARKGVREPNRLVVQLVAMHALPQRYQSWTVEMYDDAEGWISYRRANARYYARDIGTAAMGRSGEKAALVRDYVDQALGSLPANVPLVVFADAESCRGLWSGLNNGRFGVSPLPGATIGHNDLAVVRCASQHNAPRPSHQDHTSRVADPYKPDLPRAELYEHDEASVPSWILAQSSRTHRSGPEGRAGTDYTRWTLPAKRDRWMVNDWHALTAIEIAVAQAGTWQPRDLAALTARLCNQAASWDDRTRLPTPLHLAKCSDDDHPGHPPSSDAE